MATVVLAPEDVDADSARRVLAFVNAAADAQAIGARIALAVDAAAAQSSAEAIVQRRSELGGFTSVQQLNDTQNVGAECFTRIVVALTGQLPALAAATTSTSAVLASRIDALQGELSALRQTVDELRRNTHTALQAHVWSLQDVVWLGQGANVLVRITDVNGAPASHQTFTLLAHTGTLSPVSPQQQSVDASAPSNLQGAAVQLRTDELGMAQLRWSTALPATLSVSQTIALTRAVGRLPLAAAWPTAAQTELADLVAFYRAPASFELREAVDAMYRDYGQGVQDADNRGEALARWQIDSVNLLLIVQDEPSTQGARTLATASHTLLVRNWLGAFVTTFESTAASDEPLRAELQRALTRTDAQGVINDALLSVQSFVDTERGELGKAIRHRAAQVELQQFTQTQAAKLPQAAQIDVLSGLQSASKTIGEGGLTLFNAVESVRKGGPLGVNNLDLKGVVDRLGVLEVGSVKRAELQALHDSVLADVGARTDARIRTFETDVGKRLDAKADRSALTDLGTRVDRIDTGIVTLNDRATRTEQTLTGLADTTRRLDTSVTTLNGSVSTLGTRVDRSLTAVTGRLDRIDIQIRPR